MNACTGGSAHAPIGNVGKRPSSERSLGRPSTTSAKGQTGSGSPRRSVSGAAGCPGRMPDVPRSRAVAPSSSKRYVSVNGSEWRLPSRWRDATAMASASLRTSVGSEPSSRRVAIRRSPMTRTDSSLTTQSIPAMTPASSVSGL